MSTLDLKHIIIEQLSQIEDESFLTAIKTIIGLARRKVPNTNGKIILIKKSNAFWNIRLKDIISFFAQAADKKGSTSPINKAGNIINTSKTR